MKLGKIMGGRCSLNCKMVKLKEDDGRCNGEAPEDNGRCSLNCYRSEKGEARWRNGRTRGGSMHEQQWFSLSPLFSPPPPHSLVFSFISTHFPRAHHIPFSLSLPCANLIPFSHMCQPHSQILSIPSLPRGKQKLSTHSLPRGKHFLFYFKFFNKF